MDRTNDFLKLYMQVWNEGEDEARRACVERLWAEDAAHYTASLEAKGYDAIEARIAKSYRTNISDGVHLFKLAGEPDIHHGAVRLRWEMMPREGGRAVAMGSVFALIGEDGKIRADYQFTDPLPVSG